MKDEIRKAYRDDYFFYIHDEKIKKKLNRTRADEHVEPMSLL